LVLQHHFSPSLRLTFPTYKQHIADQLPNKLLRLLTWTRNEICYDLTTKLNTIRSLKSTFTPDLSTPLSKFKSLVEEKDWPRTFGAGLIGSCTNSSYQDMTRSEEIVKQASAAGLKPKADFFITPGSEQIRATLERDDTLSTFTEAGGTVLANACG
jgi:homoaconitase